MARYGTTGAKTDKELFKFAADWLNKNKPKNKKKYTLGLFKEIYKIPSDVRLQNKAGKDKPAVISLRNLKADKIRDLRLKRAKELLIAAGLKSDWKAGKDLIKQPSVGGKNADHKWEVQEFGPVYEDLIEEYAAGAIDDKEFKKRLNLFLANNPGDSVKNLEVIPGRQNQLKREDVEFKNKLLEQRELDNPSARYTSEYNKKMAAFKASPDVTKISKLEGAHKAAVKFTKYDIGQKLAEETAAHQYKIDKVVDKAKYDFEAVDFEGNGNIINGNGNGNGNGVNGRNGVNGKFKKPKLGGLRKIDQGLNFALQLKTGNYTGAAVTGSTITAAELLKTKAGQKAIARQFAKIAAKQGGKQALKLIPGLDVYISGREAWDYLRRGRFDQAGISALSGAIGWIPGIGDGASAILDLTNTGISLKRGDYDLLTDEDVDNKKTKGKGRGKVTRRTKL